jgi:hypothetical protein
MIGARPVFDCENEVCRMNRLRRLLDRWDLSLAITTTTVPI